MRKLVVKMSMSVDGFVAGPDGALDWIFRHRSERSTAYLVERLETVGLHLMGRRSFEEMAGFWPTAASPFAGPMNRIPKAVFSRSGRVALPVGQGEDPAWESWRNPRVLGTDLVADVERLKAEEGGPINALGGASFASNLVAAGLVDEFRLSVHPVALGRGLPLFAGLEEPLYLKLIDLERFETGVVVKTYRPA